MSKIIVGSLILVVLVGALWLIFGQKNYPLVNKQSTAQSTPSPSTIPNEVTVPLGTLNKSNESGVATLTQSHGQVKVHLELSGEPVNATQPAHIHLGVCPNPGVVTFPLSPVVGGVSDTIVNITMETLKNKLPLAINVHKSDADMKTYVACGDVKF